MPAGNVKGAVAVDTFPITVSTQFTESHSCLVNINEYADGSSQRQAIPSVTRRTWQLAKRLTIAQMTALKTFFDANAQNAFNFYNPFETVPPFSLTPSGNVGRYVVRFASDWNETFHMVRSEGQVELIELATDADIAAGGGTTNKNVPTSATLNIVTAHTPNAGFTPNFGAGASTQPVGFISPVPTLFSSTTTWAKRTDTFNIDPAQILGGAFFILFTLEQSGSGSSGVLSPPDQYFIYDVNVQVLYGDGTSEVYRPSASTGIIFGGATGLITNQTAAYDGDPNTFATMQVSQYMNFFNGAFLNVNRFVKVA